LPHHLPSARGWPILPISRFVFERTVHRLAKEEWANSSGSLPPFAVRDEAGIRGALAQPFQAVAGNDVYPTVRWKAAALFRNLAKAQHLVDGNKRLAVTTVTAFLRLNGYETTYTNSELYRYALRIAGTHRNVPLTRIHRWISRHTRLKSSTSLGDDRRANQELHDRFGPAFIEMSFGE
jgi:prophage maintenance system killer protein